MWVILRIMRMRPLWDVVHFIGGVITGLAATKAPVLGLIMAIVFLVYELNEDWYIKDKAYRDIRAYLVGLFITAILLLVVWHG